MLHLVESKQSLMNLGYPEPIAGIFQERFGAKAPLIARWYKEYTNYLNHGNDWWRKVSHGFRQDSIVDAVSLMTATKDFAVGKSTIETYNAIRSKLDFAPFDELEDPKELVDSLKAQIKEEFFQEIFFSRNLIQDIMAGKIANLAPYSKLPFREANDKYEEKKVFSDTAPVKSYPNGWKWIDAGKKCDLIGNKMKNCGSTGVMSTDKDKTMMTLFDQSNNPHVVATFSPNEKRLSGIEGQASTAPKNEYTDYVIDLARTIGAEIDLSHIKSKMLKLKYMLQPTWIEQIGGASDYNEFFVLQLPNGQSYYSNGFNAVPKDKADKAQLPTQPADLFGRLTAIFDYRNEDILKPIKLFDLASQTIKTESLKSFINENVRACLTSIRARS